ncbi:serine hydrolase [Luedemannella helvata]|uniref:Beta-lactamase-related domain-containing protein n=1 Tax=Luedemannella helvata TaxID=349315 RepID=A0ABP4WVM3_9ACTN
MSEGSSPAVSRRQLLLGAGAATVALAVPGMGSAAAAAPRLAPTRLAAGEAMVATHDRSHADFQNQWNTLVPQGYRPISLCVYGDRAAPLYAAVWIQRGGQPFAGIHGATAAQFQTFFDTWAGQGYTPVLLTATGPANNPVFAAVMEKSSSGVSLTRHLLRTGSNTDSGTIDYWLTQARTNNWIPRCIAPYGTGADRRFALVLDPNPNRELWSVAGWGGESASDYQQRYNAQAQQWARPALVSVNPDATITSVFRADSLGPLVARHNMTSAGYQAEANTLVGQGYYPIHVQAGGPAGSTRFAALFATRDVPAARTYTQTGTYVAAFAAVDNRVRQFMSTTGTRAVGVAITRGGRLVHARGYTWAESDYPLTQPTTMFRLASCSKPLTSIAIHQLIQQGRLSLNTTLQSVLALTPAPGGTMDSRFKNITVQHLLTHTAGWDRSEVSDLPSVNTVAAAFGQANLPVTKLQVARYMAGRPLQFAPGAEQEYSNLGYLMLGLIIEKLRGTAYPTSVQQTMFTPLGLSRPHRSIARQSQQRAGTVRQHDTAPGWDDLRIGASAIDGPAAGSSARMPLAYGGEDLVLFDAFGGWTMAPVDYAKVLAAFAVGTANPLLNQATVDMMWTVPSLYATATSVEMANYTSGWDSLTEPSGVRVFQHGGGMPGVATRILYRTDGWGFAVFASGAGVPDIYPDLANLAPSAWPTHDLFPSVGISAFPTSVTSRSATGSAPGDQRPARLRGDQVLNGSVS